MSLLLIIDRIKNKMVRTYRKAVFAKRIGCPHKNFKLVGDIYCINTNIVIGNNVTIYPGVMFFGDGRIEIGNNVDIGKDTIFYASKDGGGIRIGDNTMIAAQCYVIDADHGIEAGRPIITQKNSVSPILIESNVWIAAGVKVLKGSTIREGAVVGAGAIVKGEICSNGIAVGMPAKVKKMRSEMV